MGQHSASVDQAHVQLRGARGAFPIGWYDIVLDLFLTSTGCSVVATSSWLSFLLLKTLAHKSIVLAHGGHPLQFSQSQTCSLPFTMPTVGK